MCVTDSGVLFKGIFCFRLVEICCLYVRDISGLELICGLRFRDVAYSRFFKNIVYWYILEYFLYVAGLAMGLVQSCPSLIGLQTT